MIFKFLSFHKILQRTKSKKNLKYLIVAGFCVQKIWTSCRKLPNIFFNKGLQKPQLTAGKLGRLIWFWLFWRMFRSVLAQKQKMPLIEDPAKGGEGDILFNEVVEPPSATKKASLSDQGFVCSYECIRMWHLWCEPSGSLHSMVRGGSYLRESKGFGELI